MATNSYIAYDISITRQEGDTGSIVITVPDIISLADFTVIKFHVFRSGSTIISKELGDSSGTLNVAGQVITINLEPDDTKGYKGTNRWELEISGNPDNEVITIGKGDLIIIKERIV